MRENIWTARARDALRLAGIAPDTLAHHLRMAADLYRSDAKTLEAGNGQGGASRWAQQLHAQADQAEAWADVLES